MHYSYIKHVPRNSENHFRLKGYPYMFLWRSCFLVYSHYRALVDDSLLKKHYLVAPSDYSARGEHPPGVRSRTGSKRRDREPNSRPSTIGKLRSATGRTTRASMKTRSTSEQGLERPRTTATTVDLDITSLTESESSEEDAEEESPPREQQRKVPYDVHFCSPTLTILYSTVV